MKPITWQKFDKDERVHLDAKYNNGGIVIVESQSVPNRLFTSVRDENKIWSVMTNRLTSLKLIRYEAN